MTETAMTEDEARRALAEVRSPKLDELRAKLSTTRTSELIMLLAHPKTLTARLDEDGPYDPRSGPPKFKQTLDEAAVIAAAAAMSIADEIDRRVPVL